tara:strand:+ start:20299 stop:21246 length:948 start_codon:yes stop_codon:yes gene_type:complete
MGFLDNSGDIILDAVLTDHGRKVLAKGDGSFQITKFAVGDEEIDYSLYNINHASGSAYYDLEILQTPVLEAFTNNASSMKTKLISYDNERLLYLPMLKLNTNLNDTRQHTSGSFFIAVDQETEGTDAAATTAAVGIDSAGAHVQGILFGVSFESSNSIRVDQGIDSTEVSAQNPGLMQGLIDDMYIIQMDNRLGRIVDLTGGRIGLDYIDDDDVGFYTVDASHGIVSRNNDTTNSATQTIAGPRGTILQFKVAASLDLNTSTYLFNQLGGQTTMVNKAGSVSQSVRYIDTIIRVTGMQTGYSLDIPVRFIKTITT